MVWAYPTNITNFNSMFTYIDYLTKNNLGTLILITIFAIVAISLSIYGTQRALATSAFVTLVMSVFLNVLGVAGTKHILVCVVLLVIFIVWDKIKGDG